MKFADSELLGIPITVVVGRGLKDGKVEARVRQSGERTDVAVEDALIWVTEKHQELVGVEEARANRVTEAN